jgi:Holliday junction DNA helicase RuvA
MIGYLTGKIIQAKPTKIILAAGGVGYEVHIPVNTFEKLKPESEVSLHIHTAVKEDAITLFGFIEAAEKEMFELLISVSGVGPKSALGILSNIAVGELKSAIEAGQADRLVALPGIGRKTAERLLLELRTKVESLPIESTGAAEIGIRSEAVQALLSLGYNQKVADKTVRMLLEQSPGASLEEIIRAALKRLSG